jgi:hypothetical protein
MKHIRNKAKMQKIATGNLKECIPSFYLATKAI